VRGGRGANVRSNEPVCVVEGLLWCTDVGDGQGGLFQELECGVVQLSLSLSAVSYTVLGPLDLLCMDVGLQGRCSCVTAEFVRAVS